MCLFSLCIAKKQKQNNNNHHDDHKRKSHVWKKTVQQATMQYAGYEKRFNNGAQLTQKRIITITAKGEGKKIVSKYILEKRYNLHRQRNK